jgi:hypothetical protein
MQVSKIIRINQIWRDPEQACNILTVSSVIMCLNLVAAILELRFRMRSVNFPSEKAIKM